MQKINTLLVSLLLLCIAQSVESKTLQKTLEDYKKVLAAFEQYAPNIEVQKSEIRWADKTITKYTQVCPSDQAIKCLKEYKAIKNTLDNKVLGNLVGESFILGTVFAGIAKMCGIALQLDSNNIIIPFFSCLSLTIYQHYRIGKVAAYDTNTLKRNDHEFAPLGVNTIVHAGVAMIPFLAGYIGTHLALNRIEDFFDRSE